GLLFAQAGRPAEAEAELTLARSLRRELVAQHAGVPAYSQELADSYSHLGDLYRVAGRLPNAESAYGEALALRQRLVREYPEVAGTGAVTDGRHLFVVTAESRLLVLDASPAAALRPESQTFFQGRPAALSLDGDRLTVVSTFAAGARHGSSLAHRVFVTEFD